MIGNYEKNYILVTINLDHAFSIPMCFKLILTSMLNYTVKNPKEITPFESGTFHRAWKNPTFNAGHNLI